jgi:hypothetical protein
MSCVAAGSDTELIQVNISVIENSCARLQQHTPWQDHTAGNHNRCDWDGLTADDGEPRRSGDSETADEPSPISAESGSTLPTFQFSIVPQPHRSAANRQGERSAWRRGFHHSRPPRVNGSQDTDPDVPRSASITSQYHTIRAHSHRDFPQPPRLLRTIVSRWWTDVGIVAQRGRVPPSRSRALRIAVTVGRFRTDGPTRAARVSDACTDAGPKITALQALHQCGTPDQRPTGQTISPAAHRPIDRSCCVYDRIGSLVRYRSSSCRSNTFIAT